MRVFIRCETGGRHGLGHAMRCRALARQLAGHGATVLGISETPAATEQVTGFACLQAYHEVPFFVPGDVLVVDSKADDWANNDRVLTTMRRTGVRVVRIDHPQASPESCDLFVGPCAHWAAERVGGLAEAFGDRFLYGWQYVILDAGVAGVPPLPYDHFYTTGVPVVFCTGGADPENALEQMWEWTHERFPHTKIYARGLHSTGSLQVGTHEGQDVSNWSVVPFHRGDVHWAPLVVTMFGQTVYECLWWRRPCLVFARTSDDAAAVQRLCDRVGRAILPGGVWQAMEQTAFLERLLLAYANRFVYQCESFQSNSSSMMTYFDGRGVDRIAERILALS